MCLDRTGISISWMMKISSNQTADVCKRKDGRENVGKGIMVIGAAILDVLARPVSMQVFEKGSHPVEELRLEVGGDAANEALVLAGLGKNVWLQTVLGNDMAGRMVLESLRKAG